MKNIVALFVISILLITIPSCSSGRDGASVDNTAAKAVDYSSTIELTTQAMEKAMTDSHITGAGIALVDGQNVVWKQGFGYADKAAGTAATADTVFQVGSISKPFVAMALMQLVEQGKLDLDKPLTTYLPEFSIQNRISGVDLSQITTRQLLTHHAGLPYDAYIQSGFTFRPQEMYNVPGLLKNDWLCFAPGTVYGYSNLGATLASLVLERASGEDFVTYTDKNLFAAMQMPMTSYAPKSEMGPYLSKDYDSKGEETPYVYVNFMSAGSTLSSATDMASFIRTMLADGRCGLTTVLRSSSVREMWKVQNSAAKLDFDFQIGLYWILSDPELKYAGKVVGFSGDTSFQHSRLIILPDQQLGVIVMTNSALGGGAARTIAVTAMENALKAKKGLEPPSPPAQAAAATIPQETLAGYAGLYAGAGGGVTTLAVEGDHLRATAFSGLTYTLTPLSDGSFGISGFPGMENHVMTPANLEGWQVFVDTWLGVKLLPFLAKVSLSAPRQAWKDRVGSWVIDIPSDYYAFYNTLDISEQNGVITAVINKSLYYALDTISDTEAINVGLNTYRGDTVRVITTDGVERIYFDNFVFRKATTSASGPSKASSVQKGGGRR